MKLSRMLDLLPFFISAQSRLSASQILSSVAGTATQKSTLPNCGITVHDIRSVNVPASGFNTNGRLVNFYFHSSDTPDTKWWSIMHVKGWTNDYCSWELAGTAQMMMQELVHYM